MNAAKSYGYHLLERTQHSVTVAQKNSKQLICYNVLNFNEFESRKKHMSIVLQPCSTDIPSEEVEIWFKGADIETVHRLDKSNILNKKYLSHIEQYTKTLSEEGLRILVWAKRVISLQEVKI